MFRKIFAAVAAAGAAGAVVLAATGAASASTTVTGVTSAYDHPDTTNASGPACLSSPGGPVWARDSFISTLSAFQSSASTWQVNISDTGNFVGFADPTTCAVAASGGDFTFSYTVTVTSSKTPSQANLSSVYPGAVSTSQMVKDFFGDQSATVTGGNYRASYQDGNYVQDTSGITGDVVSSPFVLEYSCGSAMFAHWNWAVSTKPMFTQWYLFATWKPLKAGAYNLSAGSAGTYITVGKVGVGVQYHVLSSGLPNSWVHVSLPTATHSC